MKTTITRMMTLAALTVALFVPNVRSAQAERLSSGGRPPIPCASYIVQITSTYTLFSNGLSVDCYGTITDANNIKYYASGNTIVYTDGTTVYPNGTIVYPNGGGTVVLNSSL